MPPISRTPRDARSQASSGSYRRKPGKAGAHQRDPLPPRDEGAAEGDRSPDHRHSPYPTPKKQPVNSRGPAAPPVDKTPQRGPSKALLPSSLPPRPPPQSAPATPKAAARHRQSVPSSVPTKRSAAPRGQRAVQQMMCQTITSPLVVPVVVPPDPRMPNSAYERRMFEHWHGAVTPTGRVVAHSHAQEFLPLTGLRALGFPLDRIQTWVDYMRFADWHTRECLDRRLPTYPQRPMQGTRRIGLYQEDLNLWSVHEEGHPFDTVTFFRPQASRMGPRELAVLARWSAGAQYVAAR